MSENLNVLSTMTGKNTQVTHHTRKDPGLTEQVLLSLINAGAHKGTGRAACPVPTLSLLLMSPNKKERFNNQQTNQNEERPAHARKALLHD